MRLFARVMTGRFLRPDWLLSIGGYATLMTFVPAMMLAPTLLVVTGFRGVILTMQPLLLGIGVTGVAIGFFGFRSATGSRLAFFLGLFSLAVALLTWIAYLAMTHANEESRTVLSVAILGVAAAELGLVAILIALHRDRFSRRFVRFMIFSTTVGTLTNLAAMGIYFGGAYEDTPFGELLFKISAVAVGLADTVAGVGIGMLFLLLAQTGFSRTTENKRPDQ